MGKKYFSVIQFNSAAQILATQIIAQRKYRSLYGVVRGGIPLALKLSELTGLPVVHAPGGTDCLVVDDIVSTGRTRAKYEGNNFASIHIHHDTPNNRMPDFWVEKTANWIDYWWEEKGGDIHAQITRILQYIGEDPLREGLVDTPKRVVKSWKELFAGYGQHPQNVMKTFDADGYDDIVLLKDIELFSTCEHHMIPFSGRAHIAYLPDEKVIGISKLARLLEIYARRLQIQERLGNQVTTALMKYLKPKGAACIIEAQHLCMKARGVGKQNSVMVTSSMKGCFLMDDGAKSELLRLIK